MTSYVKRGDKERLISLPVALIESIVAILIVLYPVPVSIVKSNSCLIVVCPLLFIGKIAIGFLSYLLFYFYGPIKVSIK